VNTTIAASEARQAAHSDTIEYVGRFGLLAQGVSYIVVAVLALELALGLGGETDSRQGALATLKDEPAGPFILGLIALGFFGYAIWRLAQALFDRGNEGGDPPGLAKRAAQFGKAVIYLGLTWATIMLIFSDGGGGGSEEKKATGGVLGWPAGRWLVAAAGVAIIGVALFQVYRALSRKYMDEMEQHKVTENAKRILEPLGSVGILSRAIVFGVAGTFLVKAAIEYDPKEAIGLDGALQKLANAPYGGWLLGGTALGLAAFGLFCCAQAYFRDV
jgi:hypothetical protein